MPRNNLNSSIILFTSFCILSLLLGFFLNEDSTGGGKLDFVHEFLYTFYMLQ